MDRAVEKSARVVFDVMPFEPRCGDRQEAVKVCLSFIFLTRRKPQRQESFALMSENGRYTEVVLRIASLVLLRKNASVMKEDCGTVWDKGSTE